MIQREPFNDGGELSGFECELIRPLWMWTDRFFVKASDLKRVAETAGDFLAQFPRDIACRRVEIDVCMP